MNPLYLHNLFPNNPAMVNDFIQEIQMLTNGMLEDAYDVLGILITTQKRDEILMQYK
ncbi:hypothetical protein [Wielerella bovis]|uniref:hypothetical protein n=1 Tax=Wielerella bovis TaxID=2917790 RepID=UPI002019BC33|nr:hypothetical protein [Wielerella bovis]MCG7656154.1 hypothetical protein [Wielerella bovis]MCG7658379.1 hypothetical protein [Wielerella bovis]ULJ60500.1 hypothetical protein MIS44_01050 [Wielerella bovis]ULJ62707.1 hypothetical protein MIS46_01080 [Wielerella bovis]